MGLSSKQGVLKNNDDDFKMHDLYSQEFHSGLGQKDRKKTSADAMRGGLHLGLRELEARGQVQDHFPSSEFV